MHTFYQLGKNKYLGIFTRGGGVKQKNIHPCLQISTNFMYLFAIPTYARSIVYVRHKIQNCMHIKMGGKEGGIYRMYRMKY